MAKNNGIGLMLAPFLIILFIIGIAGSIYFLGQGKSGVGLIVLLVSFLIGGWGGYVIYRSAD